MEKRFGGKSIRHVRERAGATGQLGHLDFTKGPKGNDYQVKTTTGEKKKKETGQSQGWRKEKA